jgi:thioredoxin 1
MEINIVELQEKIKEGKKIIVKFGASWCGPCRMMNPAFEKVITENTTEVELYSVDVDLHREFAMDLGIRNVPTVKIFNEGEVIETVVGVLSEDHIKGKVKELVNG